MRAIVDIGCTWSVTNQYVIKKFKRLAGYTYKFFQFDSGPWNRQIEDLDELFLLADQSETSYLKAY